MSWSSRHEVFDASFRDIFETDRIIGSSLWILTLEMIAHQQITPLFDPFDSASNNEMDCLGDKRTAHGMTSVLVFTREKCMTS